MFFFFDRRQFVLNDQTKTIVQVLFYLLLLHWKGQLAYSVVAVQRV